METVNHIRIASVPQMQTLIPLLTEGLRAGQSVRFSPRGTSMLPMLREGRDSIVLSPVSGRLKKYDLPLYRRDDGKYILHRVVHVGDTYTCMGDNQFVPEPGIRQDQLLGVVTAFYRGEKCHSVSSPFYRCYCVCWHRSRFLRRFCRRAINWLRRHLKS